MILILLCDGFEEIEALMPYDILDRAAFNVKTVGLDSKEVTGTHGIKVIADLSPSEVDLSDVELVIFPGGLPGAVNLKHHDFTDKIIKAVRKNGGRLAAICAAPIVLGSRGLLKRKKAVCYPGFERELIGAEIVKDKAVVTDGKITTAKGMGSSLEFAKELVCLLRGKDVRDAIAQAIMEPSAIKDLRE